HVGRQLVGLVRARLGLAREVVHHREPARSVRVPRDEAADQVRPLLAHLRVEVPVDLPESVAIGRPSLDDLHEAGVVGASAAEELHVGAVLERGLSLDVLEDLPEPGVLLPAGGVLPRSLFGVEPRDDDHRAVVGDAARDAEVADGARRELLLGFLPHLAEAGPVLGLRPDDLGEHCPHPRFDRYVRGPTYSGGGEAATPDRGAGRTGSPGWSPIAPPRSRAGDSRLVRRSRFRAPGGDVSLGCVWRRTERPTTRWRGGL